MDHRLTLLWNWAIENGSDLSNITIVSEPNNERAIHSVSSIKPNQIIASISNKILLTESKARESFVGIALTKYLETNNAGRNNKIDLSAHEEIIDKLDDDLSLWNDVHFNNVRAKGILYLIMFIVFQKQNKESFFYPYVNTLPETFPTIPLNWSENDRDKFIGIGTNLNTQLKLKLSLLEKGYKICLAATRNIDFNITWEQFLWAFCCISSRAFPKLNGKVIGSDSTTTKSVNEGQEAIDPEVCMWPVLDMFNHKLNQPIEWNTCLLEDSICYVCKGDTDICIGIEVFSNYGPKGNEMFLGSYGFTLSPNPFDYFKITLKNSSMDPLYKEKSAFDEQIQYSHLFFMDDEELSPKLLDSLKILVANEHELQTLSFDSNRNKVASFFCLYNLLHLKRKEILAGRDLSLDFSKLSELDKEKMRLGSTYRNGQIEILEHAIELVITAAKKRLSARLDESYLTLNPSISVSLNLSWLTSGLSAELDEDSLLALLLIKEKKKGLSSRLKGFFSCSGSDLIIDENIVEHFEAEVKNACTNTTLENVTAEEFCWAIQLMSRYEISLSWEFLQAVWGITEQKKGEVYGIFL